MKNKAVVLLSGGQDSSTILIWALKKFKSVVAFNVLYGQRHNVEAHQASEICKMFDIPYKRFDFSYLNRITESDLFKVNTDINKEGENGLPVSFVPNRNQLFITLAHSFAQSLKFGNIVVGVSQIDYSGYPDCREYFIKAIEWTTNLGSDTNIKIHAPLLYKTKAEIFKMAEELGVLAIILEHTHTCYNGKRDERHEWGYGCGECNACKIRKKGYEEFRRFNSEG